MRFDRLGNTCVVGLQWGDEGKGKLVDLLAPHFDLVVRYSGGANAGHTVVRGGQTFALHQLPGGVLHEGVTAVIGCGCVLDPALLLGEIRSLRERGLEVQHRLRISDRAQLVFPYHRRQEALAEQAAPPGRKLGTTARGIGPCYADKVSRRWGIRVCELYHPQRFRQRLATVVAHKNAYLAALYDCRNPLDPAAIAREYLGFAEQLRPCVCDTAALLHERLARGQRLLFEGAQGALLDIDHGTYPFVTSTSTGLGGVVSGAGVPPGAIDSTIGVLKAYTTRVGAGPLPTELGDALGAALRERGGEYGTTTGRPRRCGWFDAVAARQAVMLSAPACLALTHLDTLSGLGELKVCVGYRRCGAISSRPPADAYELQAAEPVYETLPGWNQELRRCRRLADLPAAARDYLNLISARLATPITIVSVGPAREETILLDCGT